MPESSRKNAATWPYPRHETFERKLRESNTLWFKARGFALNPRMSYLLEQWQDWPKNIIHPKVAELIQQERTLRSDKSEGFPLHKYIHHGLSSQAMLFNLVGPLIVENDLSPLRLAFESNGISWPPENESARFEVEDRKVFNEDTGQPTSIDLVVRGKDNQNSLFIESKLVEREFGGCSVFQNGDCDGRNPASEFSRCYLHHLGRSYWSLLKKYGFLAGLAGSSPICPLAMYYQFFRELVFALESGGEFVLLYDERNPTFYRDGVKGDRGLMPFLISFVPEDLRSRVHSISIQQVVASYHQNANFSWLVEFEKKYGMV